LLLPTIAKIAVAGLMLATAGACAKPESLSAKLPDLVGIDAARGPAPSYRDAITAAPVSGGRGTTPLWVSPVGNAEFQDALVRTLIAARLGSAENARFRLDANLQRMEQPFAGFAMTVTATIGYRLTETATGAVVYDNRLVTSGTATLDDAVMNDRRLKIANDRAIRANLRRLVEELYALPDRRPLTSSPRT
jgi:hypothetical protein